MYSNSDLIHNGLVACAIVVVLVFTVFNVTNCVVQNDRITAEISVACIKQGSSYINGQCIAGKGTTP